MRFMLLFLQDLKANHKSIYTKHFCQNSDSFPFPYLVNHKNKIINTFAQYFMKRVAMFSNILF